MIYKIYYGKESHRKILCEIILHTSINDRFNLDLEKNGRYIDSHSRFFVSAFVDFMLANIEKGDFNVEEFKKDCSEIEELRGWIWEAEGNHHRQLYAWQDYLEKKIYNFSNKYGLSVNED